MQKFDTTISVRTALISGLLGFLANRYFNGSMPDEVAGMVGTVAGAAYDAVAYWVKTNLFTVKDEDPPVGD